MPRNGDIQSQIERRLRRLRRGQVLIPKDFLDVGSRDGVDQALSRLTRAGVLIRVGRGIYQLPKVNQKLGIAVPPATDDIAEALARQTGSRIVPSGATAANQMGLSTQVPARPVYLTDGRSRKAKVGNFTIVLKHVSPRELPVGSRTTAVVLQALRHLGKDSITEVILNRIRQSMSPRERSRLLRESRYTTDWIAEAIRRIALPEPESVSHG